MGMLLEKFLIGCIRLRQPLRPDVGPRQSQGERAIRGLRRRYLLQVRNARRKIADVHERSTALLVGARGRLFDHRPVECRLFLSFRLVGRATLAELPLHVPGGPLHRRGLLAVGRRPPQQVATFLVVKPVQEQEPRGVLCGPRRVGNLRERLPEEIAGLVDAQFPLRLLPALECRLRVHRRAGKLQHSEAEDGDEHAGHVGIGCTARGWGRFTTGCGMPRSSP